MSVLTDYDDLRHQKEFEILSGHERIQLLKWMLKGQNGSFIKKDYRSCKEIVGAYVCEFAFREETEYMGLKGIELVDHRRENNEQHNLNVPHMESVSDLAWWLYWKALYYKEQYENYKDFVNFTERYDEYSEFKEKFINEDGEFEYETFADSFYKNCESESTTSDQGDDEEYPESLTLEKMEDLLDPFS